MNDEISKVLHMMQEGKIDADKAAELITILQEKQSDSQVQTRQTTRNSEYVNYSTPSTGNYFDKMLKIRINSQENDNVNINLPIKIVAALLGAGHSIAASIPQASKYVKDIDIDLLINAIENELEGQIVDIRSGDSDTVSVVIE
ncbi:hypothetical protein ACFSTH_17565 [Paenibacillus yanchengensis]|uniref:YvlB/LiaX N-terminal domain-containing protein n=1 Tax=Paenibacillus yanchengensis TaxID=2035833 RepID=A0ABW4YQC3_9BACL